MGTCRSLRPGHVLAPWRHASRHFAEYSRAGSIWTSDSLPDGVLGLFQILKDTSLQKVKRNQSCLEPCLRQLVSCLESFVNQEDSASSNPFALPNSVTPPLPTFARVTTAYGSYQDANIPFPRTSGARFCGAGWYLCCSLTHNSEGV